MKNIIKRTIATVASATIVGMSGLIPTPAQAQSMFDETNVDQGRVVAMAIPHGFGGYKLLVLEQQKDTRKCWAEQGNSPVIVDPLLLNFNFTGICGRATDSNGYSIRVNGQDLALSHSLSLQSMGDQVYLVGVSRQSGEKLVIGRTNGLASGMLKVFLEPGWKFTKRTYQGKVLGHFYLSNNNFDYASQPSIPKSSVSVKPTQPTVKPVTPEQPVVKPTQPTVKPVTPEQPVVKPTQPTVKPDNNAVKPTIPTRPVIKPMPTEPTVKPTTPTEPTVKPRARSLEELLQMLRNRQIQQSSQPRM
jgi:N-acetylmuramoyl-L-alanine amidase